VSVVLFIGGHHEPGSGLIGASGGGSCTTRSGAGTGTASEHAASSGAEFVSVLFLPGGGVT